MTGHLIHRYWPSLLGALVLFVLAATPDVRAQEPPADQAELQRNTMLIGEHIELRLRVLAPEGATVELTPGTPGWEGVELVSVDSVDQAAQGDGVVWFITAKVAAFAPGQIAFTPTYAVIQGSEATPRAVAPLELSVLSSLAPDAELVLSPLRPPTEIPGAESPWLRPAIGAGVIVGSAIVALIVWLLGRTVWRRLRTEEPAPVPVEVPANLEGAEQLLHTDPVGAYRLMSSVVKNELARRYNVRATALTSTELRRRLESDGDRWEARLVGGLLEECDSVIYAGYRPAAERREHDLTMAREIVEVQA